VTSQFARLGFLLVALVSGLTGLATAQPALDLRGALPKITFESWHEAGDSDRWTEYSLEFPSAMVSASPENNTVPLRVFIPRGKDGPFPSVVILHYWGAKDIRVERSLADRLAERGIASIIMTLPYHLGRTPAGYRSGELAIQPDPEKLRFTMAQAAVDVKRTVDFIETRPEFDASRIGISGTSLGALISALAFGVDSRLTHGAFILGGADLAEILWSSSLVVDAREALRKRGFTFERLRAELTDVEPLTYLPARRESPAFVIGGKYDTIMPPASTQALIEAFDKPKTLWLETGHYGGIFVQSRILKEVTNFFETEFSGKDYVPPTRVFVPTLRIGVQASAPGGFDIGVGIDLWKSRGAAGLMGTAMLTPRGPQLFLGAPISNGLSFGVVGGTNRIGIGLLWSRVL
jgi:dienelactone hydrolase